MLFLGLVDGVGPWVVFVAQALFGVAAGLENSNEMALWQHATPDRLMGRVNASRRSVNRTLAALGAVIGGVLLQVGPAVAVGVNAVIFGAAALLVATARVRSARPEGEGAAQ